MGVNFCRAALLFAVLLSAEPFTLLANTVEHPAASFSFASHAPTLAQTGFWHQYKWIIGGTVSLLTLESLLVAALLLERRRTKVSGRLLAESEELYRRIVDGNPSLIAMEETAQELTQLTVRLFNIQDEERRRIARELHDGTAQNLFAISINLQKLGQLIPPDDPEIAQLVGESQSLVEQSLTEIRTLSYLLHPPLLDQAGLVSALQWYVEGFTRRSGIFIDLHTQPIGRLPSDVEMALFRVVQEALSNVRRHSESETASIRLEHKHSEIVLEIKDQGRGLALDGNGSDANGSVSLGVGIPGMKQRLRQLGGRLDITSNGHGTTVSVVVPVIKGANHGSNIVG
jgi:signal transduction histidine kinase